MSGLLVLNYFFVSIEDKFDQVLNRSPSKELTICLNIQNDIISKITNQAYKDNIKIPQLGYLEIPKEAFWESTSNFYKLYNLKKLYDLEFLERYSIKLGYQDDKFLKSGIFEDAWLNGTILNYCFIKINRKYLPVLPGNHITILISEFAQLYTANKPKLINDQKELYLTFGLELHNYIKNRINTNFIEPLVSAVKPKHKSHDIHYISSFIANNRLFLIYVSTNLFDTDISIELERISPKLIESLSLIHQYPHKLFLHSKSQIFELHHKDQKKIDPTLIVLIPSMKLVLHYLLFLMNFQVF